jgi:hypothetical protein
MVTATMESTSLERLCPYCGSTKLTYVEHGSGGTLFQCDLCARAAVQRWEPEVETVGKSEEREEFVFPSWYKGTDRRR